MIQSCPAADMHPEVTHSQYSLLTQSNISVSGMYESVQSLKTIHWCYIASVHIDIGNVCWVQYVPVCNLRAQVPQRQHGTLMIHSRAFTPIHLA